MEVVSKENKFCFISPLKIEKVDEEGGGTEVADVLAMLEL